MGIAVFKLVLQDFPRDILCQNEEQMLGINNLLERCLKQVKLLLIRRFTEHSQEYFSRFCSRKKVFLANIASLSMYFWWSRRESNPRPNKPITMLSTCLAAVYCREGPGQLPT